MVATLLQNLKKRARVRASTPKQITVAKNTVVKETNVTGKNLKYFLIYPTEFSLVKSLKQKIIYSVEDMQLFDVSV